MTVSSQTNNVTFVGNGVATSFPLPFRFFNNGDIRAFKIDATTGVSTQLVIGVDYTLIGAGEPEVDGNALSILTLTSPLAMLLALYVERVMSPVQETDIVNQGEFFAATHEDVFDRLTMLIQQANANSAGAIRVAIGDPEPARLNPAAQRANLLLGFDSFGQPIAVAPVSGSAADLALALANGTEPSKGAALIGIGQTTLRHVSGSRVHIKQFGAKGDNATNDILAFDAAIAYLQSIGGGILDLGDTTGNIANYRISRPWALTDNLAIVGKARILPTVGFSSAGVVFPTYGTEVPQVYSCLAYFNLGTHADDPTNFGYAGLAISKDVTFDCQYHVQAANGLILEGITNYELSQTVTQCLSLGVWVKYYCWGGAVNGYLINCRTALLKMGPASNGIDLSGLRAYGQNDTPTYGIIIDGDNNGLDLSGAFVEKCANQILIVGGNGPMTISGVDFEICSGVAIDIDGTGAPRAVGPIVISGAFLEAGVACVRVTNAIAVVTGCRIRSTPLAFKAIGGASRIYETGNVFEASVAKISEGNVVSEQQSNSAHVNSVVLPWASGAVQTAYKLNVNTYSYNESLPTHFLDFKTQLADAGLQRQLTSSSWVTREMRSGAVFGELGLTLDYSAGIKNIVPYTAGDTSLGTKAVPFDRVYGEALVQCAGVAVGVNPLANGELVMQFTSNTQVTIKGMGSDGVVRVANITLA